MTSTQPKIVVVFGATGKQGGSVAKAILSDPVTSKQFKVRAVTRDPAKPEAKTLIELGAEIVKADLDDKESLREALTGAYGLYLVTNPWDNGSAALEEQQGKNVADVAKELNVKHFIWSSLPYVSKISNNKYTAAGHFDHKAAVDEYLRSLSLPYTVVRLGIYTEMLWDFIAPLPTDPPVYGLCFPGVADGKVELPIIDPTADLGKWIKAILLAPEKTIGQSYNLAVKCYTLDEITSTFQQLGLKIHLQPLDIQIFKAGLSARGLPEFFQTAMEHVTQYTVEFGYFGSEGIDQGLELVKEPLTTLAQTLKADPKLEQFLNGP